jgi:hypothetical protein
VAFGDSFDERLDDTSALEGAVSARIARALWFTPTGGAENRWRKPRYLVADLCERIHPWSRMPSAACRMRAERRIPCASR